MFKRNLLASATLSVGLLLGVGQAYADCMVADGRGHNSNCYMTAECGYYSWCVEIACEVSVAEHDQGCPYLTWEAQCVWVGCANPFFNCESCG